MGVLRSTGIYGGLTLFPPGLYAQAPGALGQGDPAGRFQPRHLGEDGRQER
jgi:hypothetical protein